MARNRWYPSRYSLVAALALLATGGVYLVVAYSQVTYPGFTESMEGDVLQHVERAATGKSIYPAPSPDYVPLAYMPLFYYMAAPFYMVFGDSLFGPRLLSVICALISAGLICRITTRETESLGSGILATAFFCAGYRIMDACLFCALPDALSLLWLLLGYTFWAYGKTRRDDLCWLVCFSLAFWTKQHGALYFGGVVLYAMLFRQNALPRYGILAGILLGGPIAYGTVALIAGEQFVYHTLTVPEQWERSVMVSLRRTAFVLACSAPLAVVAAFDLAYRRWRQGNLTPTPLGWYTLVTFGAAVTTMMTSGASNNHYVPLLAMSSVLVAICCHRIRITDGASSCLLVPLALFLPVTVAVTAVAKALFSNHPVPLHVPVALGLATVGFFLLERTRFLQSRRGVGAAITLILCQLAISWYSPLNCLPPSGWQEATTRLDQELSKLDGPVIWLTYGRTPGDLLPHHLERAPSWVAVEDLERQVGNHSRIDFALTPFRDSICERHGLYLLTDTRIDDPDRPVWSSLRNSVTLVKEFGDQYADMRQFMEHWYAVDGVPRYLYRVR